MKKHITDFNGFVNESTQNIDLLPISSKFIKKQKANFGVTPHISDKIELGSIYYQKNTSNDTHFVDFYCVVGIERLQYGDGGNILLAKMNSVDDKPTTIDKNSPILIAGIQDLNDSTGKYNFPRIRTKTSTIPFATLLGSEIYGVEVDYGYLKESLNEAKTNKLEVELHLVASTENLNNEFLHLVENLKKESIELEGIGSLSDFSIDKSDYRYFVYWEEYYKIKAVLSTNKPEKSIANRIKKEIQFLVVKEFSPNFQLRKILLLSDVHGLDNINPHVSNKIEVGAIMCSSWGYEQTNIDFYCVVDVKGEFAYLAKMKSELVDVKGWATRTNKAGMIDKTIPVIKKKIKRNSIYNDMVSISSYELATLWDGKPRESTHYGN